MISTLIPPILFLPALLLFSAPRALDVQINTPTDGATVVGSLLIQGTSTDVGNGKVSVRIDDGPFFPALGTDSWVFPWDSTSVTDGPHTITARAREFVGGPAAFDTVQVLVANQGGLSVSIVTPADGSVVLDTLVVSGTSSGADKVELRVDQGPFQLANGLDPWSVVIEAGALSQGPHTLTARATSGAQTVADSVSIDVGVPSPGTSTITYLSSVDAAPISSRLFVPSGLASAPGKVPLVIHLHGGGGPGQISAAMSAQLEARTWIGLAPDGREWGLANQGCTWQWSAAYVDNPDPAVGPGERDIFDGIDWACANFPIDKDRIYLTGFSMGGRGTYIIGLRNPDLFAAIAPMGAVIDMFEVLVRRPEPCECKEGMTGGKPGDSLFTDTLYKITSGRFLIENAFNLPVFHAHGTLDGVANNNPSVAPFLHGWHITTDSSWNSAFVTPAGWSNSCPTVPGSLPFVFDFGHTPTLVELNTRHPEGYDWAYQFTPVGHVTDPGWLDGSPAQPGSFGVADPAHPGQLLGIYDFFAARTLVHSPDRVVYKTYTDQHRRAYWLAVGSAVPWTDTPAAARATRDVASNRVDAELARVAELGIDLDLAGLSLGSPAPLRIGLSKLVEPVFDPALAATGEPLAPSVRLTGDFAAISSLLVLQDGVPLDPAAVSLDASEIVIGAVAVGASATELSIAPCTGSIVAYGNGSAGTGGFVPSLSGIGCAQPGAAVTLSLEDGLGGAAALLAIGLQAASLPIGGGATLLVGPPSQLLFLPTTLTPGAAGEGAWSQTWALPAGLAGSLGFQLLVQDAAAAIGFATSNGVELGLP